MVYANLQGQTATVDTLIAGVLQGNGALLTGISTGGGGTSNNASLLTSGTLDNARLPQTISISGPVTAASFSGSGASLSALNASNVSTGTLAIARGGTGTTTSTGSGSVVLSNAPTFTGNVIASNINATAVTGDGSGLTALNASSISTGTLAVARGGTGTTASTGTGSVVLNDGPTFTGTIGAQSISATGFYGTFYGTGSGLSSLNASNVTTGTLAVLRGGTGVTTSTGTGSVVLSNAPTLTGITTAATINATTVTGDGSGMTNLNPNNLSGSVPVAKGGTGVTSSTGTAGSIVFSGGPTFTGTVSANEISGVAINATTLRVGGAPPNIGTTFATRTGANILICEAATVETAGPFQIGSGATNRSMYLNSTTGTGTTVIIDANNRIAKSSSSRRYKTNIQYMSEPYVNKAWEMKPVLFQYKPNEDNSIDTVRMCAGFIAEDLDDIEMKEGVFYDQHGIPDSLEPYALIGITVGALQQLRQRVLALEQRLSVLENK